MSFLSLNSLWFLLVIPPVVILYLLKVRREERTISSTLLWQQVINDLAANTPFQRLRKNILMILQILILAAVVFALIRPFVKGSSVPTRSTVIIVDNSASMNATQDGKTRLEMAKDEALKLLSESSSKRSSEFMIMTANRDVRTLSGFSSDRHILNSRVQSLEATDLPDNLTDALLIAASAIKDRKDSSIYLITDGCLKTPLEKIPEIADKLKIVQVGSPAENLAIGNLAAENLGEGNAYEIYVSVRNYSGEEKSAILSTYDGDALIDVSEMKLAPHEEKGRSFISVPESGTIRCEIDSNDAMKADDSAYCVIEEEKSTSVLLVSPGAVFLTKALATIENCEISLASPTDFTTAMAETSDVVIFDRFVPSILPGKKCVFIAPDGDVGKVMLGGTVESLIVTDFDKDNPLLRFVSLGDLYISEMRQIKNPEAISSIASSKGVPVMGNFVAGGIEHFLIGFDLNTSDWAVRPSFPMFVSNLVAEVAASNRTISSANFSAGNVIEVRKKAPDEESAVTFPDGTKKEIGDGSAYVKFFDTARAGLYKFDIGGKTLPVAVNFFDREESNVLEPADLAGSDVASDVTSSVQAVNKEIWKYFVVGAFCVGLIEWICFHRKIQ